LISFRCQRAARSFREEDEDER